MKAISSGNKFEIYTDTLHIYDELPAQTYIVRFNKMSGFYLEVYSELDIEEEKLYGVHFEKVDKVLNAFGCIHRNLGVMLTGDKGIGKTLFAKALAMKSIDEGLPVIIVDRYLPGIASYLEQIEQEVVIFMDEFDKTFGDVKASDNEVDPQASLLSLFDGISPGKKLFVITCNEIAKLNEYLVNRPGRFHYHFQFQYPTADEVKEYLLDKLEAGCQGEIDEVINFSKKVNLNYDCLRAIAFELNTGDAFKEVIKDLNIINMRPSKYLIELCFEDGTKMMSGEGYLDLFDNEETEVYLYDEKGRNCIDIRFNPTKAEDDSFNFRSIIYPKDFIIIYNENLDKMLMDKIKALKPRVLTITKKMNKGYHYMI